MYVNMMHIRLTNDHYIFAMTFTFNWLLPYTSLLEQQQRDESCHNTINDSTCFSKNLITKEEELKTK
jgi:hypothetical protein